MELALRAAIELERAEESLSWDAKPVKKLGEALSDAASLEASGARLSLAESGSLQPFRRLYGSENPVDSGKSLAKFLSGNADKLLSLSTALPARSEIEHVIEFCVRLHEVLRSNSRAEREMHARGRRKYDFTASFSRGPV